MPLLNRFKRMLRLLISIFLLMPLAVIAQSVDTAKQLSEVVISFHKNTVEHKSDRTVFNVSSSIASTGSNILEVIKKIPGVRVSNNEISIAGKSTVSIMVNDRLVQFTGDELAAYLKSISADVVSKVEVITTPPSKYDAQGNSGIINIVTKKSLQNGLNGSATASYFKNSLGHFAGSGMFNYRHDKINIYGNGNVNQVFYKPVEQTTTYFSNETVYQRSDNKDKSAYGRGQIGLDYKINNNSILGVVYTNGVGRPSFYDNINTRYINTNTALDSFIRSNAHTYEKGQRHVANLNYEWNIDTTGKKLKIDLDYLTRTGNKSRDFETTDFLADGSLAGFTNKNRTDGRQVVDIRSAKADIDWPSALAKFSFGGKASFITNTSDNIFRNWQNGDYIIDPLRTDKFDYTENTQAIYFSAKRSLNKFDLQAGLRSEYTQTKGTSHALNQTHTNEYLKLFPTLYIQYNANDDNSFNLSISRRINRPSFWDMNPFRYYSTINSYQEGNPFLQPSFATTAELSYVFKSDYTFKIFALSEQNGFSDIISIDTVLHAYYIKKANLGKATNFGFDFSAEPHIADWWECSINATVYYSSFKTAYYGSANNFSKFSWNASTTNSFVLNASKTLLAELNFEYQANNQENVQVQFATSNLNGGVKALFFDKKLTVALEFNDLFATDRYHLKNLVNNAETNSYYDERYLGFSLTYKFGSSKVKAFRQRNNGTDESKRAG